MAYYTVGHRKIYFIGDPESESLALLTTTTGAPVKYADIIANYNSDNPYTDPDFPPTDDSIGTISLDSANAANNYPNWDGTFTWFRAAEAVAKTSGAKSTKFVYTNQRETFSRLDVRQGTLGDCWFLACASAVSSDQNLIEFIAPSDNLTNNDSGAYHFRIFHLGIWVDVVVDDHIVCAEFFGPGNGWYVVTCSPPVTSGVAELWPTLLEKAYAKLNGSYGNIESNDPLVGLEDLTGGVGERIMLGASADAYETLFNTLQQVTQLRSFIALGSIAPKGSLSTADFDAVGLHYPHAYSLNSHAVVNHNGISTKLIRARNPWGRSEWNGAWSDSSPEWNSVDAATKKQIGLVVADDGEFWMSFDDMVKYFSELEICYWVSEDDYAKESSVFTLEAFNSEWSVANNTAGGYSQPQLNPQYPITVVGDAAGTGILIVGIQIKDSITKQIVTPWLTLLYKVADPTKYQTPYGEDFFKDPENKLVEKSNIQVTEGDVYFGLNESPRGTTGFRLNSGTYVIVPSLQFESLEAKFLIQIVAQKSQVSLLRKPDTTAPETVGDLILEA